MKITFSKVLFLSSQQNGNHLATVLLTNQLWCWWLRVRNGNWPTNNPLCQFPKAEFGRRELISTDTDNVLAEHKPRVHDHKWSTCGNGVSADKRTFSGFRSQCTICREWRCFNAIRICKYFTRHRRHHYKLQNATLCHKKHNYTLMLKLLGLQIAQSS